LNDEFAAALPKFARGLCQIKYQLDRLFRVTNAVFESRRVHRQATECLSRKRKAMAKYVFSLSLASLLFSCPLLAQEEHQKTYFVMAFRFTAQRLRRLSTNASRFKYSIGRAKESVQLDLDLALALRELGQRRRKFVDQFGDLELGDIQLDADACPQAP
jgi:hypothetical protein